MLDSRQWKSAKTAASLPFQLDGDAVPSSLGSRTSSRRTWISTTEGTVTRASGALVWIEGDAPPGERRLETATALRHSLPGAIDPCALVGRHVRATLVHVASVDAGLAQTLTIATDAGQPLVIAHAGPVRGLAHTLGATTVYVALSQRPGGPMVFGTSRVQSLVRQGDHVRVRDGDDVYVMHFTSRGVSDAAYVLVEESLWKGPPSTRR